MSGRATRTAGWLALGCAVTLGVLNASSALAATSAQPSAVVATSGGPIQGVHEDGVAVFKGIPYGAAPLGEARFLPPQPAPAWQNILDATGYGAPAIQLYDRALSGAAISLQLATVFTTQSERKIDNEDSLFLNIWAPVAGVQAEPPGKRPILVWLHGGGFAYGSGSWPVYDGANLARQGDVVVVTVNHRLNVFGYLQLGSLLGPEYMESGNAGMLDLVLALQWVRANAATFGGDAGNVTIMGESGGGQKVSTLLAMPAAAGLFHKAIIQSGPGLTGVPLADADTTAAAIVTELGLAGATPAQTKARLQGAPVAELLQAVNAARAKLGGWNAARLAPVQGTASLPLHPFTPGAPEQARDIPVLIGWNKDEFTIFNVGADWFGSLGAIELPARFGEVAGAQAGTLLDAYQAQYPDYTPTYLYNALLGDRRMFAGSVTLAERKVAQAGAPVFMYYLVWETPVAGGVFKSPHTLDMPFMFGNVDKAIALTGDSPAARSLETQMSQSWLAFARSGNPANPAVPAWPAYTPQDRATMVFDDPPRVERDPKRAIRLALQR